MALTPASALLSIVSSLSGQLIQNTFGPKISVLLCFPLFQFRWKDVYVFMGSEKNLLCKTG